MKGCLTIILLVILLLTGCADSGDSANEQATSEEKSTNERTARRENRAILMGVITDVYHVKRTTSRQVTQHKWITVDEDPDANCREGPVESGCEKLDFDLNEARVWRQEGSSRRAASVADLKEGQRVVADYTGYPIWKPYRGTTSARTIVILKSPQKRPAE